MLGTLSIVALGFFLGMRHATDADHVVAVTTIVSRERSVRLAAWLGAIWGVGHTLTIVLVGGVIILLNIVIPPRVGLLMELAVGVMLVVLGVSTVVRAARLRDGHPHTAEALAPGEESRWRHLLRPLTIGVVHGLAGSAAVALLVLTTIQDPTWALAYLLVFGLGTVAGMVLVTTIVALPFAYTSHRLAPMHRRLQIATGLLSVGFGVLLAYQIGYLDGLFTANPSWAPH